jgi:Na+-driven multidrug efflux pump
MGYDLLNISVPAILSAIFTFLFEVINLIFVGHLNDAAIVAGVGLANTLLNQFYMPLSFGLNFTTSS